MSTVTCGVPQGVFLGPLFYMINISNLNLAIKYYKVHHFSDDSNLLNISKSPQKLHKLINADLKN